MMKKRFGELEPKYSFLLNKYINLRFSKCPQCNKRTYKRKFPLILHIDGFGIISLGKTSIFCSSCELIIVHKDELESELVYIFNKLKPEIIGNDYVIIGTMKKNIWKKRINCNQTESFRTERKYIADFKNYFYYK